MSSILDALRLLKENYPDAKYYLNFSNPLELMVAAIMSAQVRDDAVNAATPKIFKKYRNPKDYANANPSELANEMKGITFASVKAKNIVSACRILVDKYDCKVPSMMEDLISLHGVGRKTANTILINAFGKVEGIPTDTHVIRVSYRLGWTKSKKPDEIEIDLMKTMPKSEWKSIAYLLKAHGRAVCKAPLPYCSKCFLFKMCPKQGVTNRY